jgi:hypothetical protein
MNILPLVLALVLMLTVLTVEKLEKFKNQTVVQAQYQLFLKNSEKQVFNRREKRLYGDFDTSLRQLSFCHIVNKETREKDAKVTEQLRMLMIELMKIVYGEAAFFKNLERKRSNFLEEMLNKVQEAADNAPKKTIKRIEDIARLKLEDPELQDAFYHMLKGTVKREKIDFANLKDAKQEIKEKTYVSLFRFINDIEEPRIMVQRAPREILKAVFVSDEVVEDIIVRRNELAAKKTSGSEDAFKDEFVTKRRDGLDDKLLDFTISGSNKSAYD